MGTKVYDNALDLITFSRASGGTSLRKISYGSELVTNGTFDTDVSGWTATGSATITWNSGVADIATSGSYAGLYRNLSLTTGVLMQWEVTISNYTSGNIRFGTKSTDMAGTTSNISVTPITANGSYTYYAVVPANSNSLFVRNEINASFSVDNISVKEVLFDQPDGTLTLFNHPDNIPRIDYNVDGTVKGLLIEEQRTNLVQYSEDFSTGWTRQNLSVIGTQTGPDGIANSASVIESSSTSFSLLYDQLSVLAGTVYTQGIFAKAGTSDELLIRHYNGTDGFFGASVFDLTAGTATGSGVIENFGNGWYRCSVPATPSVNSTARTYYQFNTPTIGGTLVIYGAQFEAGSFATSYIPTEGIAKTRSADIASIPVTDFGYNQKAGTVVVEFETPDVSGGTPSSAFSISDGTSSNAVESYSGTAAHFYVRDSGVEQVSIDLGQITADVVTKISVGFKQNDFAACLDGGSPSTDTSGTVPLVTTLQLGANRDQGVKLNGHIKSIQYYPRKLSDTQLQELTS